jgi:epoxyqueuosine reductase
LIEWLTRDPATWRTLLKGTALARAKRAGLVRNAALVLGARRLERAVAPLAALLDDPREDPTVRAAAAWALRRIDTAKAREALARQVADPDAHVRDSVDNAPSAAEP